VGEWEEGRITMDEYLDIAVFHCSREFSRRDFVDFMFAQSVPNESVVALARSLTSERRFTLMTLNNEADELNRHRIEKFGISDVFEAFLSSCWLGVRKPTRRFYSRALAIAQADPATSLFVDDREQNVHPAQALGMQAILFTSAEKLRSDLERALQHEFSGA
jgi:putative hydrolase of the HAD superfamily